MKEGEADLRRCFLLIKDWMVPSRLNQMNKNMAHSSREREMKRMILEFYEEVIKIKKYGMALLWIYQQRDFTIGAVTKMDNDVWPILEDIQKERWILCISKWEDWRWGVVKCLLIKKFHRNNF